MKHSIFQYFFLILSIGCLWLAIPACKTEDINPLVSLSLDSLSNSRISEDNGVGVLQLSLNGKAKKDVLIKLSFTGTAKKDSDFTVSAQEIRIKEGALSGTVTIKSIDNNIISGDKTIIVSFVNLENASLFKASSDTIYVSDDDKDTDKDGLNDNKDACPLDSGAIEDNGCPKGYGLIINEVLYDPSNTGLEGDANGDGAYNKESDGFIEFYNKSDNPVRLGGFTISDLVISGGLTTVRYTFPENIILAPGKALVVFGGDSAIGRFGGSRLLFVKTSSGLSMNNSGEKILVKDSNNKLLLTFDSDALSGNPNESYTRNSDITGDFIQHGTAFPGKLFSPGTKINGIDF